MDIDSDSGELSAVVTSCIGAIALTFLFTGLALAIYPSWPSIGEWAQKSDAPSWVQAVGSIGAICAAIAIAAWQWHIGQRQLARHSAEARFKERKLHRSRKYMVLAAAGYVRFVVKEQIKRIEQHKNDQDLEVVLARLHQLRTYCEQFPVWRMENSKLAGRWWGILEAVGNAEAIIEYKSNDIFKALNSIVQLCNRLQSDFDSPGEDLLNMAADLGWD